MICRSQYPHSSLGSVTTPLRRSSWAATAPPHHIFIAGLLLHGAKEWRTPTLSHGSLACPGQPLPTCSATTAQRNNHPTRTITRDSREVVCWRELGREPGMAEGHSSAGHEPCSPRQFPIQYRPANVDSFSHRRHLNRIAWARRGKDETCTHENLEHREMKELTNEEIWCWRIWNWLGSR